MTNFSFEVLDNRKVRIKCGDSIFTVDPMDLFELRKVCFFAMADWKERFGKIDNRDPSRGVVVESKEVQ